MLIAYWHKEGIEVYRLSNGKVMKVAAGNLDQLKPFKDWGRKVLIVGRDLLLHTRRKYPSASSDDIKKAVQMEINEIFPIKNTSYFTRIFEKTHNYTLVDIWAWDCSEYDKLKALFPFNHLLPEDMAFVSDNPEITILQNDDVSYTLAHSRNGFLGVSTIKGNISPEHIKIFLKGLVRYSGEIKRINIFDKGWKERLAEGLQEPSIEIVSREKKGYPICLDNIVKLNLKEFKVKSEGLFSLNIDLILRAGIYLLLAYSFFLYLTGRNYSRSVNDINAEIDILSKDVAAINTSQKSDHTDVIREIGEKLNMNYTPLRAMDILAKNLPDKSLVTRMVLNENKLELSLSSKEPLDVIKALGNAEGVKSVKLKGAPNKDPSTGSYTFVLLVEM